MGLHASTVGAPILPDELSNAGQAVGQYDEVFLAPLRSRAGRRPS
jgi:hypothetical protein